MTLECGGSSCPELPWLSPRWARTTVLLDAIRWLPRILPSYLLHCRPITCMKARATTAFRLTFALLSPLRRVSLTPPSSLSLFRTMSSTKLGSQSAAGVIDYAPSARSLQGPKSSLRTLYPPIDAYESGKLAVDGHHELYYEWSGNPDGYPVVFLHGGPGGGVSPDDRRWFDPAHYRVLTFDQRGAGKSTPHADLKDNTTWHLVSDIEALREKFNVTKWHVFGGSWGSTLSLAYSQKHPDRVSALILRGIFTLRRSELIYFYQNGASHIFPEQWEPYRDGIPEDERDDFIAAYNKRLTSKDPEVRLDAARRWSTWENATSKLYVDGEALKKGEEDKVRSSIFLCLY